MASVYGTSITLSIFGQSHSPAIGFSLDGVPAGIAIDTEQVQQLLDRRAPGRSRTATARRETDTVEFIAGLTDGHTNGAPIAGIIRNGDTRSRDYDELRRIPRPGHADYPAYVKYRGYHDVAGGGHFSGRLTAPLCAAGAIACQALESRGICIVAHISSLGTEPILDMPLDPLHLNPSQATLIRANALPCVSTAAASAMHDAILGAKAEQDSIGGIIECAAYGMPAGIGDPMFDGIENRIAQIAFGIPAVKGIEFGAGFQAARMLGSQNNDPYRVSDGEVAVQSNNAGGILGGITTAAPIIWRMAVKPTPSIAQTQASIDLEHMSDVDLSIHGRHDPCIVPRAVPVAEAACALALMDALLTDEGAAAFTGTTTADDHKD